MLVDEELSEQQLKTNSKSSHSRLGLSERDMKHFTTYFLPTVLKWVGQNLSEWHTEDDEQLQGAFEDACDAIFTKIYNNRPECLVLLDAPNRKFFLSVVR